ncbi:ABC transporter ATP-binding protein [Microtetraspora sp. NBRC 13810]|uniref:ABC transporter ATP-binding protein n=1 Tax=Microtetraspora sp. NBRC 13810 TaxID=3030990 RepID=UPI0024A31219|nr:ATP-binding cassette domain-containing protein [Microtetraspora sp. NBRC 13810]GLW10989.1 ABC transporter ATP-binding protein [Microtetraspora sp. NBRC 13810]
MTADTTGDMTADMAAAGPDVPLLEAVGLRRGYPLPRTSLTGRRARREAVRDVSLRVEEGAALGIVGESGAGKSTLVRLLLALDRPDAGTVRYRGREVRPGRPSSLRWFRREAQIVLQDPMSSLDPRMTVARAVAEPLRALGVAGDRAATAARVAEVLTAVGLEPEMGRRYPHEFSGGQRQRIAIARALAPRPRILVGDEPVSALDVSVRAQVLDLLARLAATEGLTLIVVSHDLGVVRHLCDQVLILHEGAVAEHGPTARVLTDPAHPYTRRLLDAVPRLPV